MYKISELLDKVDDFESLSQQEKVKILSFFYLLETSKDSFSSSEIKECFLKENLKLPSNLSREFTNLSKRKPPVFLKRKDVFFFERNSKKKLDGQYIGSTNSKVISLTLRTLLTHIKSDQQKVFLEECINCFEIRAYRSAIVMSWLMALDIIFNYIIRYKLDDFNAAIQLHGKYKKVVIYNKDDFNDLKESDFIELLRVSKIVSNDSRKILDEKLHFRNTCAHPNGIVIKDTKVIAFIEDLIENVILKFNV